MVSTALAERRLANPITLVRLAVLVACLWAVGTTQADPDLWGHVRFGGDIVAARAVPRVDTYSFTSDRPVVEHEWLSEVLMFGAYRWAGAPGLVLLKLAIVVGLVAVVVGQLRRIPTIARDRLVALLVLGSLLRLIPVRPQLFSLALFALVLAALEAVDRGRWRVLFAIPPLMAVWANLHGGWIVGLGVLVVWTFGTIVEPGTPWRRRVLVLVAAVASALATLLNAYGLELWRFLSETVGLQRADVSDWQPIYRLPAFGVATWVLTAGTAAWLAFRLRRNVPPKYLAVVALLGVLSYRVSRIDAFFTIAVVMLLGPFVTATRVFVDDEVRPSPFRSQRVAAGAFAAAALALVAVSVAFGQRARCIEMNRAFMPEPHAANFVLVNHLAGRMVTYFDWGQYAIWHFSPAVHVSIDGRRETAYTNATIEANHRFFFQERGAGLSYADRAGADYVWTPNAMPVAARLRQRGWVAVFNGPASTIFARPGDHRRYTAPISMQVSACFPGP